MNGGEENFSVIIAGGGTGGHLFPGIAVGREIAKKFPGADILFVTAGRELETQILERAGFTQESITVEGIKGKGILGSLKSLFKLPLSLFQSLAVIKKISPDIILGVGGYSSGPICLSGWLKRIPVVIHEQNSYPGLTNRLLSRIVDHVFISFEESRNYFSSGELMLTGNPVRDEFAVGNIYKNEFSWNNHQLLIKDFLKYEIGPRAKRKKKTENIEIYFKDIEKTTSEIYRILDDEKYFCVLFGQTGKFYDGKPIETYVQDIIENIGFEAEIPPINRNITKHRNPYKNIASERIYIFKKI